jgi:glyceraldehyde 3-phosphate dehydrogenase
MKKTFNVAINGLGRIGRSIFRQILYFHEDVKIKSINDINPDINNIAYTLNYDSLYGRSDFNVRTENFRLIFDNKNYDPIAVHNQRKIQEIDWDKNNIEILIDSSGILENVKNAKETLKKNKKLKKIIITHSPETDIDFYMVLGANEENYSTDKHHVISSSICDSTALAPVLKVINNKYGIQNGSITTIHPVLSYQNILDGKSSSWSNPDNIHHEYALGRSIVGNIIPKPTSAINATLKVLKDIDKKKLNSFSYRTENLIVGSADLTLNVDTVTTKKEVIKIFEEYEKKQNFSILKNTYEPLVSLDFMKTKYSAFIDHRWTLVNDKMIKIVLWYDNEYGYSSKVIDQIKLIHNLMK